MSKKVVVAVKCANGHANDRPHSFAVDISDELKSRIIELSKVVKQANANNINEFNFSGTWSAVSLDEYDLDCDIDAVCVALSESKSRVGLNLLEVRDEWFNWSSVPRHCDDDMKCTSNSIPISFLTGNDQIYTES